MGSDPIFKSTCSYCGVGCGIEITRNRAGVLELRGDPAHPANRGMLCAKGQSLLHTLRATDNRLRHPMLRLSRQNEYVRVSWDQAMKHAADRFKSIIAQYGPDAVAFYVSGQCLTEEYYLANKIAKGFISTNNIDTNSRLCMSSAVMGYKATLGSDAPPISYDDIELCDTFLIAGANPAWCHPILFRRMEARKAADPNVRMIVIDPRRTATCASSDLHLQIKPGTDVALFLGLARQLWKTGHIDQNFVDNHTRGWDDYFESLAPWTLRHTAEVCGVRVEDIALAAEWLGGDRRFLSMWTMGLNQSATGTAKNIALISLSLITGKIGKPGCGPFSLTGQPNAMGGREVGGMATLLSAHRDLANPQHREYVAKFWGVPSDRIPATPGLTAVDLFSALADGRVKAVWIIATNPVASLPNSWQIDNALKKAEFVVVQDIYPTETTDYADLVFPAAGWGEKTGTMTNSDRRISLLEKFHDPPGEARADADILIQFARVMGWQDHFKYSTSADVYGEYARLTRHTDLDISALNYDLLRQKGSVQWPCAARDDGEYGTARLYTNHHFATSDGRAILNPLEFQDLSEPISADFPLVLTTGRIRDHWHTMTKTGRVNKLNAHIDSPFCEIHPDDARDRNVQNDDIVSVYSARGQVQVRAVVTTDIRPGVIFLPMHWGKKLGGEHGRTNNLTSPRYDSVSKEPDLKFAAAQVIRFRPQKRRIVIVGGGAACVSFVEQHRKYNTVDTLTIFSGEQGPLYNRVLLPHYIDGSRSFQSMIRADDEFFSSHQVTCHTSTRIDRIDRASRLIWDDRGNSHSYDTLILATGSRPAIPFDGVKPEHGIFTLRSRLDADRILDAAQKARHAVVVGGGLLGLEVAGALKKLNLAVTILQRSDRLMGKQLDMVAANHLAEMMTRQGIELHFETSLYKLNGAPHLSSIEIMTGSSGEKQKRTLPCEMLIFATGIVPNKELAVSSGLECDRGIKVNSIMQTSDPNVFAIGECAQLGHHTFGTTPAAEQQARALVEYLRGNLHAPYRGTVSANILKVHGIQLAAAGTVDIPQNGLNAHPDLQVITMHDPAQQYYQKLVIDRDRLIGAICLGDTARFSEYLELIETGLELDDRRATLLRPGGQAHQVDGALICSCNRVGRNTILQAALSCKGDMQKVCASTRAGTACGSCKPEIKLIISQSGVCVS